MSDISPTPPVVAGLRPWFPWPFSAWTWWTEPVRAERLALLRIGVAACVLADLCFHYAPEVLTYFAQGSLGDPAIFHWRFQPPRMTWSLLRGVGDGATVYLSFTLLVLTTCWILGMSIARLLLLQRNPPLQDSTGIALMLWSCALGIYVAGLWATIITTGKIDDLAWLVPLGGLSLCALFHALDLLLRLRDPAHRVRWPSIVFSFLLCLALTAVGFWLWQSEPDDSAVWNIPLLQPWQNDRTLLITAMVLWLLSAFLLGIGCCTRLAAIATWLLSMSFANANPYLDNAGDTIRQILLFYLMLCPCGAVWSVDALWQKRPGPVYVHPWPICLLMVQMIFMYCMNGFYKLFGESWLLGNSLYYVLGDAVLTRFSQVRLPIPHVVTQMMTWSVMIWEASFPVLVLWKWSRRIALVFGVLFHLGIFASMELGMFVPYALCIYLPFIPWPKENSEPPASASA